MIGPVPICARWWHTMTSWPSTNLSQSSTEQMCHFTVWLQSDANLQEIGYRTLTSNQNGNDSKSIRNGKNPPSGIISHCIRSSGREFRHLNFNVVDVNNLFIICKLQLNALDMKHLHTVTSRPHSSIASATEVGSLSSLNFILAIFLLLEQMRLCGVVGLMGIRPQIHITIIWNFNY